MCFGVKDNIREICVRGKIDRPRRLSFVSGRSLLPNGVDRTRPAADLMIHEMDWQAWLICKWKNEAFGLRH
jgi:hypothetical protein